MQTPQFNLTKVAYSVNEILQILPLGRTALYSAIKNKKLRATKFGRKTLFLAPDVVEFLAALPPLNGGTA